MQEKYMIKKIIKPFDLLACLFLIQLAAICVFWYGIVPVSDMIEGHQSNTANPYLSEMNFKDDLQKSYYEESWFPKQTDKAIFMVFSDFGFNDLVDCSEEESPICQHFNQNTEPFRFQNNHLSEFYKREANKILLIQANSDLPLIKEWRLQSLLSSNYIGYEDYLSKIFKNKLDYDTIMYQSNRINNQTYLVSDYNDELIHNLNEDHYNNLYFKEDINSTQQLLDLQKNIDKEFIFFYKRLNETFLQLQQVEIKTESNKDQIFQNYFDENIQILLEAFGQCKTLPQHLTVIGMGQYGYISDSEENLETYVRQQQGFALGYDRRGFIQKQFENIYNQNYPNEISSIDVSATISMLMGQPLPKNNLGILIPKFFLDINEVDNYIIANNFYTNLRQVEDYLRELQSQKKELSFAELDGIEELSILAKENYKKLFKNHNILLDHNLNEFIYSAINYIKEVKSAIKQELITPNENLMNFSILIALFNIVLLVIGCVLMNHYQRRINQSLQYKEFGCIENTVILIGFLVLAICSFQFTHRGFSKLLILVFGLLQMAILYSFFQVSFDTQSQILPQMKNMIHIIVQNFTSQNVSSLIDIFIFSSSLILAIYSQSSKSSILNYNNYILLFILTISLVYFSYIIISKLMKGQVSYLTGSNTKSLIVSLIIFFSSFYLTFYFNPTKEFQNSSLFFQDISDIMLNDSFIMLFTSVLFIIQFSFITTKTIQNINQSITKGSKFIFIVLQVLQILLTLGYFLCFFRQNNKNEQDDEQSLGGNLQNWFCYIMYPTFITSCLFQQFFLKQGQGVVWNYTAFSINLILFTMTSLDKYSFPVVILFLVSLISFGNIVLNKKQICYHSKYPILFLLSLSFFYSSGHSQQLDELFQPFLVENSPYNLDSFGFLMRVSLNILAGFSYVCILLPYFYIIDSIQTQSASQELTNSTKMSFIEFIFNCSLFASQNSFQILEMEQIMSSQGSSQMQSEEFTSPQGSPTNIRKNNPQNSLKSSNHLLSSSSILKLQFPLMMSILTLLFNCQSSPESVLTHSYFIPELFAYGIIYFSLNIIYFIQNKIAKYDTILLREYKVQ